MKTLEFSERQLTWLLLALQHYEVELQARFFAGRGWLAGRPADSPGSAQEGGSGKAGNAACI
jgi:hypothetical protein